MRDGGVDAMSMPMLPVWLRVVCVVVLGAVVVVHIGHGWARPGQRRWWHAGHVVMAAGMALMYGLPAMGHAVWNRAGLALFSLATIALAAVTVVLRGREGVLNPLWLFSGLDMLAMTYMFVPSSFRPSLLTVVFLAYLAGQVAAWGSGLWDRLPVWRRGGTGAPAARAVASSVHAGVRGPALLSAEPVAETEPEPVVGLTLHSTVAVRLTIAVMAAGMAAMLALMSM